MGRTLGRRLANHARPWLDPTATFLILVVMKGRAALAPIPIDASSAKIRRSRMVHRR